MRKVLGLLLVLAMVAAACGDDDAGDPGSIDSCEGLVSAGLDLLQTAIDEIDDMSMEELASEEAPPAIQELEEQGQALETRAAELNCSDEELGTLLAERVDELSSDSLFGQALIESLRAGDVDLFGEG